MPASILLLTATTPRFMGAVAVSAEEGANQGRAIVSTKAFPGLCAVGEQMEREWRTCEFVHLEDLLDFDCVLLLLRGRNDASRAAHFLKRAGELPEYKHFVGKLGSVFFVPGAEPIDLEDRRKELASEMMKLGFLTAELPHSILADNEVATPALTSLADCMLFPSKVACCRLLSVSIEWEREFRSPAIRRHECAMSGQ
ncbi:hypothetical protein [Sinorhizobium meliloti]|uniref:hypothetical protein n=1 Tax=Rhizobium meliloti TaxID=382 RepID=UPI000FDA4FF6|nr:hypothetical protein [Sinorhizobium meliloti]RVE80224.1 hypothetical protein CN238_31655 [Sinorhizobium meliloti]RVG58710.1 hypothetical protein CN220_34105 [Sinorhizobium meliloti]RVH18467.1 hypothetical protein CN214_34165 [Sinorhizobium meliloti]RVH22811.1 hypothetical protein CN211_33470 [Sinorhizobium meliloti]RVH54023.1 hypothetical protein CN212_00020 [Sinorhizobium meliloti]